MATKEEILYKQGEAWEYSNTLKVTPVYNAYIAMEEYAKQEAILFAKFINTHKLDYQSTLCGKWMGLNLEIFSSEYIYELYLRSKK